MTLLKNFSIVIFLLAILKLGESIKYVKTLTSDAKPANLANHEGCFIKAYDMFIEVGTQRGPKDQTCTGYLCTADQGMIVEFGCEATSTPTNPGNPKLPFPYCCPKPCEC